MAPNCSGIAPARPPPFPAEEQRLGDGARLAPYAATACAATRRSARRPRAARASSARSGREPSAWGLSGKVETDFGKGGCPNVERKEVKGCVGPACVKHNDEGFGASVSLAD
jgi:hypothetical protein